MWLFIQTVRETRLSDDRATDAHAAHGANAGNDEEATMALDQLPDTVRPDTSRPDFPHYEWVFRCDLSLGGLAPGHRRARFQGHDIPYIGSDDTRTGARWCSRAWLRRTDTGVRGPAIRRQGGISRLGMRVTGAVTGGDVIVVPDDQVATAARLAGDLVTPRPGSDETAVREWSMALVREPGRTRIAVGFGQVTPAVRQRLTDELDVEWVIRFGERSPGGGRHHTHDHCRIETPDGTHSTWRFGTIHHDNEAIPAHVVDIARTAHGHTTRRPTRRSTPVILVDNPSYRPLEPDESARTGDARES